MTKFIKFNDKVVDALLFIQLQDMMHLLMKTDEYQLKLGYGHTIDTIEKTVTISHFWDNRPIDDQKIGWKTDLLLRVAGSHQHTSKKEIRRLLEETKELKYPIFIQSLFAFFEDIRTEELIKKEKRGTKKWFQKRNDLLLYYFKTQLEVNNGKNFLMDVLYCMTIATILSGQYEPMFQVSDEIEGLFEQIKQNLYALYEARETSDIVDIVIGIAFKLSNYFEHDMINTYFIYPFHQTSIYQNEFDDLKRKDKLANCDTEIMKKDESQTEDEKFSTWHREQENKDREQGFLRFELENGTKTNLLGNGLRDGDEGDQALAQVQGNSVNTNKNEDYHEQILDKKNRSVKKEQFPYGEQNRYAKHISFEIRKPTVEEKLLYHQVKKDLYPEIKLLQKSISTTLEHKNNQESGNQKIGRLSKKMLPVFTEENPRVFYRKRSVSKEIDAVFTLLIDCSASMHDKMDETKKGIILFHEVLKKLGIQHAIAGFWEDAFEAKKEFQPNYYQEVISYEQSLHEKNSEAIMQLEPREDNRDGFSMRVAKEKLSKRKEKNKFLLVFSDGEPSAYDYNENGIIDTFEAVNEMNKWGIDVLGFYLSNGPITETEERYMKNIYGNHHLLIPKIEELPFIFSNILKKLILKSL